MKITKSPLLAISFLVLIGCTKTPIEKFVERVVEYSNYSTVRWRELQSRYYRPNTADWGEHIDAKFCAEFPQEVAAGWWHLLQNARTDFHHKSLPVRATLSPEAVRALDHTESLFDTVFVRCVEQEYYMRLLPEVYNEVMSQAIDKLTEVINQEY